MELNNFHFENILWFWGLLAIPIIWVINRFFSFRNTNLARLETFIDKDLLPHLLLNKKNEQNAVWKSVFLWSTLWILLIAALAGPRWGYQEIETFLPNQNLLILLDLSRSMDIDDIKPSRLIRARQKIEDILNLAQGVKIGLIAFAATPHMITPLTDDKEALRNLLPSLDTDLVYTQGSKLSPALIMASRLLEAVPGNNKSLLIITDGGFEDSSAIAMAHDLAQKGFIINALGVGTEEGGPVQDDNGNFMKKQGKIVISKLENDKLLEISRVGNGQYLQMHYSDEDVRTLLNRIREKSKAEERTPQKIRQWEERFYIFILPLMAIVLFWFRKGFIFPVVFFFLFMLGYQTQAKGLEDFFKNNQQLGKEALERGDYDIATQKFKDPYRQGVAHYKAGNFAEAEKLFRQSVRLEVATEATYNLGNALAKQRKLEEAMSAYEKVLEKSPNHTKAKHNLEIVKKLLEQQKKQDDQRQKADQQQTDKQQKKNDQTNKSDNQEDKNNQNTDESQDSRNPNNKDNHKNDKNLDNNPEKEKQDEKQKEKQLENKTNNQDPSSHQKETKETGQDQQQQENLRSQKEDSGENDLETNSAQRTEDQRITGQKTKSLNSQQDIDADQWLNRITNNPKSFLKNQFYIESQQNGPMEVTEPW
ncbi:MAG: hypothetical protein BGO67_02715 [Alphaproteobacteria bacterium 41-28]|nr:MAG: hypothetical protein BGO67_02715 [Alphaproteobacteria bacterium 41-28]